MARFLRTVLHQNVSLAAGAVPLEKNLGVNPISFLTLTLRLLNNGANAVPSLSNILATISNVEAIFKGTSIFSGRLNDLVALVQHLWGCPPVIAHRSKVDNDILNVTTWIPFTRKPYWMREAFPATRSGDFILKLTPAASFTGLDTLTMQVEQTELLDANPEQFIKVTTKAATAAATGKADYDLPLGNPIIGVLLFGTTAPDAAAATASMTTVKVLVDNVEYGYSLSNWESLYGDGGLRSYPYREISEHVHISDLGAAYTQFQDTGAAQFIDITAHQHAYLEFDPLKDDGYLLETEGRGKVALQIDHGVADAIRFLPVELVRLPGARAAAGPA